MQSRWKTQNLTLSLILHIVNRLKEYLHAKLIECGWQDEMKEQAKEVISSKGGITKITVDELASELVNYGKHTIPDEIKLSILKKLRENKDNDC